MRPFRELRAWQLAKRVAVETYRVTGTFPRTEQLGLTGQMRRAAVSVPANIAEGSGRGTDAEMIRYLRIALGSLAELDSHLEIASDLGFATVEAASTLRGAIDETRQAVLAFIRALSGK